MDTSQLLEIGIQKRNKQIDTSWQELADLHSNGMFVTGEAFRCWVKTQLRSKGKNLSTSITNQTLKDVLTLPNYKEETEIHKDGSQSSNKLLHMSIEESRNVEFLLKAHGYCNKSWELISAKNNIWNSYSKKDGIMTLYSSKVSVRPIVDIGSESFNEATISLQKQKIQIQDQKREFADLIKSQAKFEHLKEEVNKSILEVAKLKPLEFKEIKKVVTNKKGIALWSDWHFGADFKNSLNTYNPDIFRQRIQTLMIKTIAAAKKNDIDEIVVAQLGDAIMGAIHVSSRVQASEDVIRQIQIVSEVIAECVAELANTFKKVKLINIIGNHSRLISNKTESIFTENLENLIPWYVESRLKDFQNVEIAKDEDGYYVEVIDGESFVFVHGDLDHISSMAKTLPQMLGIVPKYMMSAHIHHNTVKEHGKTTVISNGSGMGVDTYAISKRYFAEPMQKFMVLDGSDIECNYDIKLA